MNVLFDDQIFSAQTYGGISRYFVELMTRFRADASLGIDVVTPNIWSKNRHLLDAGRGRRLPTPLGRRGRVLRLANSRMKPTALPDVIHHTYYYRHYLGRYRESALRVVTVYDMIPELFPETFPLGNPHLAKRAYVDAADLIICISESTRRDLLDIYGTPTAPVVVTHLGVDDRFRPGAPKPAALPGRYVLFVGARSGYKDFAVLAEAFASAEVATDVKLVALGGGTLDETEMNLLNKLGISHRVQRLDVSDGELAAAYANAECFVFPSRYEGFGLPTLEAMASGCPAILAESSSHVEVGGDAALYFPPGDSAALAEQLVELLGDGGLRVARTKLGLRHVERFTWVETARKTVDAYRDRGVV